MILTFCWVLGQNVLLYAICRQGSLRVRGPKSENSGIRKFCFLFHLLFSVLLMIFLPSLWCLFKIEIVNLKKNGAPHNNWERILLGVRAAYLRSCQGNTVPVVMRVAQAISIQKTHSLQRNMLWYCKGHWRLLDYWHKHEDPMYLSSLSLFRETPRKCRASKHDIQTGKGHFLCSWGANRP